MHWPQQAHDNGAILDLLPNHKGAIRPGQKIGHKTHDDVESDICHTEALNQRLLGGVKDSLRLHNLTILELLSIEATDNIFNICIYHLQITDFKIR